VYDNNLLITGNISINSNIIINEEKTIINTNIKGKGLELENNILETLLTLKQNGNEKIISASNSNNEVFTILNNGNVGINNTLPLYLLDVDGNINASSFSANGIPIALEISQGMIVQTKHITYTKMEVKNGTNWVAINNNIADGFVISIKPSDITSKILVSIVCHIGMEYLSDSRWWGLRLYRKIGILGSWDEIESANGNKTGNASENIQGTGCWISHNLGADSSTYSHSITNVSGAYQDTPNTTEMVYYTVYWKNRVGELSNGLLYLNKSDKMLDYNYPCPSSSWTAVEIWNKGTSYIPPLQTTQIQINTQYNNVGIDTSPSTDLYKLNVNGNMNIIDGIYSVNGNDIIENTSNYIRNTSNILLSKIEELLARIQTLENA
jgi:hypothetical protein